MRLLLLVCFAALALAHMSPLEKLVEALELEVSLEEEDSVACGYDYDYDQCKSRAKRATCLTDHSPYGKRASTNGKHWYQIQGSTYRVGDNCYLALTSCLNCLWSPASHPTHLKNVDCGADTKGCPERPARPTRPKRPTRPTFPRPKLKLECVTEGKSVMAGYKCCLGLDAVRKERFGFEYSVCEVKPLIADVCQVKSCAKRQPGSRKTETHCAITSTNEHEVAAPCSGPKFDGTCGIEKCKKECEARAGCHGFSATTGAGVTAEEYDTCWLDMGAEAGEADYYNNDGGLSVAYTCADSEEEDM